MEIITRELPDNYTLIDTGDWHLGSVNCNKEAISDLVAAVKRRKNCYMVIKGDICDGIVGADKRWAAHSVDYSIPTPQEQAEEATALIKPIADKVIGISLGNHEYTHINTFNIADYICKNLKIKYGGIHFKVIAQDSNGDLMHKFFFTHGAGSINSLAKDPIQAKANMLASLKNKLHRLAGDTIYQSMGHTHRLLVVEPTVAQEVVIVDDGNTLRQQYRTTVPQNSKWIPPECRYFGNTGSFLKTFSDHGKLSYAESAMYPPSEMGWLEVKVKDKEVVDVTKVVV